MKKLSTFFATMLVSVLLIGSTSFAQTTWTGATSSDWSVTTNWSTSSVPLSTTDVTIPNGTVNTPQLSGTSVCQGLTISSGATLNLNGKQLTASGAVTVAGTINSSAASAILIVTPSKITINSGGLLDATNIPDIRVAGDWNNSGAFTIGATGNVNFNGSSAQTIGGSNPTTFYDLTTNTGGTGAFLQTNIQVNDQLNLNSGTLTAVGSVNITLAGGNANPFITTGTFVPGTSSTVFYQGTNTGQTLDFGPFYNLTLNNASVTFSSSAGLSVNNLLTLSTGTLNDGGGTISLGGNFSKTGGTFTATTGTLNCDGVVAQTLPPGLSYANLTINNTNGVSLLGTAAISLTLTITAGTFSDGGYQISTPSSPGALTLTSAGTLKLGATNATTLPTFSNTTFLGTIEYAATNNQTVKGGVTYTTLVLSGSGSIKTANGIITTTNITLNGVTFNDGGFTHLVSGQWLNIGTVTYAGLGTISFSGSAAISSLSTAYFNNLTITGGTRTTNTNLNIAGNFDASAGGQLSVGALAVTVGGYWNAGSAGYTGSNSALVTLTGTGARTVTGTANFDNLTVSGSVIAATTLNIIYGFTNNGGFADGNNIINYSGGTFTSTAAMTLTGTLNFVGSTAQTLTVTASQLFNNINLTSGGAHSLFVSSPGISVGGTLTVGDGTNAYTLVLSGASITGSGTFALTNAATLDFMSTAGITSVIIGPTLSLNGGANYILRGTATPTQGLPATVNNLTFAGTASSTLSGVTVNGVLTFSGSGSTTVTNTLANGNLYLTSGVVKLAASSGLTIAAGKTIYVTAGSITLAPALAGTINLIYQNTAGNNINTGKEVPANSTLLTNLTTGAGSLTLMSNVWVNGTLTLGGIVFSGTSSGTNLIMISGATISGSSSSTKFVDGTMGWQFPNASPQTSTYPIGVQSASINRDVTLTLTATPLTTVFVKMVNSSAAALSKSLGAGLQAVSNVRYYTLTSSPATTLTATTSTITLNYLADEGVTDRASLDIATDNGGTIWNGTSSTTGGSGNGSGHIVSGYLSSTPGTLAGNYTLANKDYGNNPLPVELTSFTGVSNENNITLNWKTATEVNSFKFAVERSLDKVTWVSVGTVKAAGNSNAPKNYTLTDKNVTGGTSFNYRLMMVNPSGVTEDFGKVITVAVGVPTKFDLSQNYPNPFNPSTTIKFSVPKATVVTLKVYNMIGQEVATLVNEQKEIGFYSLTWNGKNNFNAQVASGVYIYRIVAGDFVSVKKMNLLK